MCTYVCKYLLLLTGTGDAFPSTSGSDGDEEDTWSGGFLGKLGLITLIPGVVSSSTFSCSKQNIPNYTTVIQQ